MVDSVGKKLSQARLKRGLTLEEVAHVTKLRPDKIVALETDDYSSFPSNAYAKGFLQIYARYLRVDVTEFLSSLDSSNSISVSDYQYLSNAPTPKVAEPERRRERNPPSIAPLVFFVLVVLVGLLTMWFITNYQRTVPSRAADTEDSASKPAQSTPAPAPVPAHAAAAPAKPDKAPLSSEIKPVAPPAIAPAAVAPLAHPLVSAPPTPTPPPSPGGSALTADNSPIAAPFAVPTPRLGTSALSDRDFVNPTAVPTPDLADVTSPRSGLNEVLVASIKKTWVTIRRDNPKGPPIFEDYIYPNTNPLKLKGARFFIDARDPSSVQITKNGLPFAYPEPDVPVQ